MKTRIRNSAFAATAVLALFASPAVMGHWNPNQELPEKRCVDGPKDPGQSLILELNREVAIRLVKAILKSDINDSVFTIVATRADLQNLLVQTAHARPFGGPECD